MGEISQGVYVTPALNAAACSLLSSYTLISILDHERWMKEWGDEHEAVAVMHLRTPILSAAVAMGIGGITTVHQVALSSLRLDGEIELGANVLCTCLAAVTGITTMFAMLYVARKDAFGGVDRVERLKEVILKRHTIAELKLKKGLGKKAAYLGQLQHIVAAGTILAMGIIGCWALNVLGLTGEFMVVWRTSGIVMLAFYLLVTSIVSCWLLFRVLVWKPSYEYLRPLCSVVFAISVWSVDLFGKTIAITFEYAGDGLGRVGLGWSVGASRDGGEWLMIMMAFGAVITQYAIALELRLAYCGLQDTNLDLQSRSIRVQPAMNCSKVLVYEPSVAEDLEEDNNLPHPFLPILRHPPHKPPPVASPPGQASASSVEEGRWTRRPTSDGRGSPPPVAVDYSSRSAL